MKKLLALIPVLAILILPGYAQNQIKNPGFENEKEGWNFWGGEQEEDPHSGDYSMKVYADEFKWSGADQKVMIPEGVKKVELAGWMKTENVVKGSNPWEMARIACEFLDEGGSQVGGYPPVTGQAMGTTAWTLYKKIYTVPEGAREIKIMLALGNAKGSVWYDDIDLKLINETGQSVKAGQITGPTNEGEWYKLETNVKKDGSHYVDWSSLLDAPAGKHGFIKTVDGHFKFEDGTPVRFWGTNIVAGNCFPSKAKADSMAARLAKMGCNLVRLHHMDAPWAKPNIFGGNTLTRTLSSESLDKLDYLIAALKKKGIYIFMDLLVHREFSEEDGVSNKPPDLGGKQVGYFDAKIIQLQKEYARNLLTHKNAYTGKAYTDEPAIVASEFINESSAFIHFGGDILNEAYRLELEEQFAAEYPGKKLSVFALDYGKAGGPRIMEKSGTNGDVDESISFLNGVEKKYYAEMYKELRKIGVKYPLSGSNFPIPVLSYQKNNTATDFIITNDYWDHPQLWKTGGDWSRVLYAPVDNTSQIRTPAKSTINNICKYKWNNMAFLVTEYNDCYPNEYLLEGAPFVSAYSALQGADGMLHFDFDGYAVGEERINSLSLARSPEFLAQWVAAAPMFLRGDIKTANGLVLDHISEKASSSLPLYSDFLDQHPTLPLITKVAKTYKQEKADEPSKYDSYYDAAEKITRSETGELTCNSKQGFMEINSPKVQGITGALNSKEFDLPIMKVKVNNSWASVIAVSKDNLPLSESKNFYLVVVGPTKMSGQIYNDSRSALVDIGTLPIMAQVINGEVSLKTKGTVSILPLSVDGIKGKALPVEQKNNLQVFNLTQGRTFVYEVILK
ncbi:MAG: carbohydrate binding domain-containing protein [Cytophagaceae bacterium]